MWFQSEEGELPKDSAIAQWQQYLETASSMFGKRLNAAGGMAEAMRGVGFVDVRDEVIKVFCSRSISVTGLPRMMNLELTSTGPHRRLAPQSQAQRSRSLAAGPDARFYRAHLPRLLPSYLTVEHVGDASLHCADPE